MQENGDPDSTLFSSVATLHFSVLLLVQDKQGAPLTPLPGLHPAQYARGSLITCTVLTTVPLPCWLLQTGEAIRRRRGGKEAVRVFVSPPVPLPDGGLGLRWAVPLLHSRFWWFQFCPQPGQEAGERAII